MTTIPIFDPVNNVKIFNGSSHFLQIPATSINLSNGFAILATFTPTSNVNNETLCSFFQGTSAANSFNIARSGTGNQYNFNLINNAGITQAISLGNFVSGIKYKLLVQSTVYVAPTSATQVLTQNVAKATYYNGTSIINSISGYATSATLNFTNSGYLSTTPLYIYLYDGNTWNLATTTTCATTSVNLVGLSSNQSGIYRAGMTILTDANNIGYNLTQSIYTSFNTYSVPTIGTIGIGTSQFTIGAATYSGGYISGTAINYTIALSPFTTYTNSTNSTLGAASTVISGLITNTQYQIRSIISDPTNTTLYTSPIYTAASASFYNPPYSQISTNSFRVTWNSPGTPLQYTIIDLVIKLTAYPFTQVASQLGIDAIQSGITTIYFINGFTPNTSYTSYLTPYNGDNIASPSISASIYTLATARLAATPITEITASGFTVNWNSSTSYSSINVRVNLTASPYTQVYSQTGFSGTSAAITGLSANIGYTVYLDAVNGDGTVNSAVATTTTTTLGSVTLAGTPITGLSTNGFTVNWISSSSYSSLNIRVNLTASPYTQVFSQNNLTGTSVAVTGLSPNIGYTAFFDIYNVNSLVNTGGVSTSTVTLATATLAATPITNLLDTSLTVNWNSSTTYTSITVRVNLTASPYSQIFAQTGYTGTSANVTGLTASTNYTIYLDAVNSNSVNNSSVASTTTTTSAPLALYTFTSFTFTPAGATGVSGPTLTQMRTYANTASGGGSWTQNSAYINVGTGTQTGMWLWTVPKTASYTFATAGASGGYQNGAFAPGRGVIVNATVNLTQNDIIVILVGQKGGNQSGGAGGTFVYNNTTSTLLMVGGGGGGCASWGAGVDAQTGNSGRVGNGTADSFYGNPGTGGSSGGGGGIQTGGTSNGIYSPGGGAGYTGNGGAALSSTTSSYIAKSFANGGTGGAAGQGVGGFGGGGAATPTVGQNNNSGPMGGGGGGYSGGGAAGCQYGNGSYDIPRGGGGGGSYVIGSAAGVTYGYNPTNASANSSNDGYVTVTMN